MLIEVKKDILNPDSKKATRKGDIPANVFKNSTSTHLPFLRNIISSCIGKTKFPDGYKLAGISPIFKKKFS